MFFCGLLLLLAFVGSLGVFLAFISAVFGLYSVACDKILVFLFFVSKLPLFVRVSLLLLCLVWVWGVGAYKGATPIYIKWCGHTLLPQGIFGKIFRKGVGGAWKCLTWGVRMCYNVLWVWGDEKNGGVLIWRRVGSMVRSLGLCR